MKRALALAIVLALGLAHGVAFADDDAVDVDGDGDIDEDDRALLEQGEQVHVEGKSTATALTESARAVTVVKLEQARERAADLGEVLAREHGIAVRRTGGLGSSARLSLNGLSDEQIRFFLDGVPLRLAGWGLGIANVPVNLIARADVYRGVVPIALGADALGGAIDLITDPTWYGRAAASYEVGSFGTHRGTLGLRSRDDATGLVVGINTFLDRSRNDYRVDVDVADERGRITEQSVRRFHDAYTAAGGTVEAGIAQRDWITHALVRGFHVQYAKELQHNPVMTVPFGEATYGGTTRGVAGDVLLEPRAWRIRVVGGATRETTYFHDVATKVYNWLGEAVLDRIHRGETGFDPVDQQNRETSVFVRASAERAFGAHRVRVAIAPTWSRRHGIDFLDPNPAGRDPINAHRNVNALVTGLEHEVTARGDALQNIAFVKSYRLATDAEDPRAMFTFATLKSTKNHVGLGDSLRYQLAPTLLAKASYEWATRLPSTDELFGDGVLVVQNLALAAERSHNANLGAQLAQPTAIGTWTIDATAFARLADNLIVLLGNERSLSYQNVFGARILGGEGAVAWDAPTHWLSARVNATYQDIRNDASEGTFGAFDGDRIPNRPWLLASAELTYRRRSALRADDELLIYGASRYVHSYLRGWESAGIRQYKQEIPSQLVHGAGISYSTRGASPITTSLELQNLTDARVYDTYGVQRPGRALFLKLSAELL